MTEDDKIAAGMEEICPPQVSVFPSAAFPAPLLAWEPVDAGGGEIRGYLITQPQISLYLWSPLSGDRQSENPKGELTGAFLSDARNVGGLFEGGFEVMTFPEARDAAEEALREWVQLHGRTLVQHVETEAAVAEGLRHNDEGLTDDPVPAYHRADEGASPFARN